MSTGEVNGGFRLPLSPLKPNDGGSQRRSEGKRAAGTRIPAATPPAPSIGSRIPRASTTPPAQPSTGIGSRIPRLSLAPQAGDAPAGFSAYCNPSFVGDDDAARPAGGGAASEGTFGAWGQQQATPAGPPAPPPAGAAGGLPTPEALQILHQINRRTPGAQPEGVRDIMNAYLRTGPHALSPEASADYTIAAPKPAALRARGIMNFAAPGGVGVVGAVHEFLRTGAHQLSPEPGYAAGPAVAVPEPLLGVAAAAGPKPRGSGIPAPPRQVEATPEAPERRSDQGGVPASVCSNAPAVAAAAWHAQHAAAPAEQRDAPAEQARPQPQPDAQSAAPAPKPAQPHSSGMPTARLWAAARSALPRPPAAEPSPNEPPSRPPSRLVSPVAFHLLSSSPDSVDVKKPAAQPPSSSGSFSFGMGGAASPDDGVHQRPAPPPQLQQEQQPTGEGPEQANPFVSMLHHLRRGGPRAYASPAQRRGRRRPAPEPASPACDSPQSPAQCTPLQLLPEGVPPSSTPELGKGNLQAWIDRRGMRAALTPAALADLESLWAAMRERRGAAADAEEAAAANAALRADLAAVNAQLARLGQERGAAVAAAAAGQEWAEAEVARAREAAHHMMALADQIQATFALCEEEKAAMAADLEEAHRRAEAAAAAAADVAAQAVAAGREAAGRELGVAEAARAEVKAALAAAQRAQREAQAATAAARASEMELAAARAALLEAQEELAAADCAGAAAPAAPSPGGAATPVTRLQAQLQGVHESLAALHAAGRHQGGAGASPALDRMLAASHRELQRAHDLLGADAQQLHAENEVLREQVAAARERLAAASPPGAPRAPASPAAAGSEGGGEETPAASPDPYALASGTTLTVDFMDLQQAMMGGSLSGQALSDAGTAAEAAPPAEGGCSVVVEGMRVTNIPAAQLSSVRAMVSFFETLAQGEDGGSSSEEDEEEEEAVPSPPPPAAPPVQARAEQQQPAGGDGAGPAAALASEAAEGDADVAAELEEIVGAAVEAGLGGVPLRLAALLPEGLAVTPGPTASRRAAPAPSSALRAPACTPADPRAAAQGDAATSCSSGSPVVAEARSPEPAQALEFEGGHAAPPSPAAGEGEATPEASPVPSEPASLGLPPISPLGSLTVSPLDMAALLGQHDANGPGVKDAVRARLRRLKADLRAAQTRLHDVDKGLAAIATPTSRAPAAPPATQPAQRAQQQQQEASVVEAAPAAPPPPSPQQQDDFAETTPVAPPPEVAPKTRASVRWADSVQDNCGSSRRAAVRPGTPAAAFPPPGDLAPEAVGSTRGPLHPHDQNSPAAAQLPRPAPPSAVHSTAGVGPAVGAPAATPMRRINLDSDDSDSDSDSDSEDEGLASTSDAASRMALRAGSAAPFWAAPPTTPASSAGGRTPVRHRPAALTPQSSHLSSASSFAPPEPVALMAVRPVAGGRVRRGGRRPSESDDREFLRRAAALKIHVSPYFKRNAGGRAQREADGGRLRTVE